MSPIGVRFESIPHFFSIYIQVGLRRLRSNIIRFYAYFYVRFQLVYVLT
ncbi:hypothetical protein Hanom_Chr08g00743571 [Helianthus anomalus]